MRNMSIKNRLLKNSLLSCTAILAIGTGLTLNYQDVKAAETPTTQTAQQDNASGQKSAPNAENVEKSVPVSETKSTTPVAQQPQTVAPKVVSPAPETDTTSNIKPTATNNVTATQQVNSVTKAAANTVGSVEITPDNIKDNFDAHGSAVITNDNQGTVNLTPDTNNKVGNVTLNKKIDLNHDFKLDAEVNLGNKTENKGGADGMGFAFHTGNTDAIGNAGGNMGIGGLPDAIGFKLDTFHNDYHTPASAKDGSEIDPNNSNDFGWDVDPHVPNNTFGAFVSTKSTNKKTQNGQMANRLWAKVDTTPGSVQAFDARSLDGKFHPLTITYTAGTTDQGQIEIVYNKQYTWKKSVPKSDKALALSITSSTGGNKNAHSIRIKK